MLTDADKAYIEARVKTALGFLEDGEPLASVIGTEIALAGERQKVERDALWARSYADGWRAHIDGAPQEANPHAYNSEGYRAWWSGWMSNHNAKHVNETCPAESLITAMRLAEHKVDQAMQGRAGALEVALWALRDALKGAGNA